MVPANEDAVIALFVILDVAKGSCDSAEESAFKGERTVTWSAACSKLSGNPSSLGMRTKEPNGW